MRRWFGKLGLWAGVFALALAPGRALDPAALRAELDQQDALAGPPPPPPVPEAQLFGGTPAPSEPVVVAASQVAPQQPPPPLALAASQAAAGQAPNPLLQEYRRRTLQYEKDATEAAKAAEMYAGMTKSLLDSGTIKANTQAMASSEMNRVGVPLWSHATWQVEQMLYNPKPGQAAKAFAAATVPYAKLEAQYAAAQAAYDSASGGYGFRVTIDRGVANKMQTYANQARLQGDTKTADKFEADAASLMGQAENFAGLSKSYHSTATRMHQMRLQIGGMGVQAGSLAAYWKDPTVSMGPQHVFPFTVVPPLEFAQTGAEHHVQKSDAKEGGGILHTLHKNLLAVSRAAAR